MSGMPAGYEDSYSSDDDYIYDDYDDPNQIKIVQQTDGIHENSASNNHLPNTGFGGFMQVDKKSIEEEVSLKSEDLRSSIINKKIDLVEKFLRNGSSTETILQGGWTGLMYAANYGHHEIVKLLLEKKADPNFRKDMVTPLMALCMSDKRNEVELSSCAKILIQNGAKVNMHDRHLMTPLMYAAKQGFVKVVKALCEEEAEIDKQEMRGWTALCFAAANGASHVVRMLLEFKADINITTYDGQRCADIAFTNGYSMLSEMLEKYDGSATEQFQSLPPAGVSSRRTETSSRYVKYGDLELFLYGLELGHLVPVLQDQHLEFKDLLKLTDDEMIAIGIKQLGARKKLLNAIRDVHSNEWDMKSLSNEHKTKLSMLETAAVVANIAKHLSCIESSVVFVNKHLLDKKEELSADNTQLQKSLLDQCAETLIVSNRLYNDVIKLNNDAKWLFPNVDQKPINLIENSKQSSKSGNKRLQFIGFIAVLSVSIFGAYKLNLRKS